MLTIIVFVVLVVLSILCCIFSKQNNDWWFGASIIFSLGLLCMMLSLCNINKNFEYTIEKYNNLKEQVEIYNKMEDHTKIASVEYDIREEVLNTNNMISKHKIMCNSIWVSCWYSEKIGNLEKLKLNQ